MAAAAAPRPASSPSPPRSPSPPLLSPADADSFEVVEPVAKRLVPGVAVDRWAGEDEEDDVKVRPGGPSPCGVGTGLAERTERGRGATGSGSGLPRAAAIWGRVCGAGGGEAQGRAGEAPRRGTGSLPLG